MAKLSEGAKDILSRLKKNTTIEFTNTFDKYDLAKSTEVATPIPLLNLALSGKFFDGGISRGVTVWAGEKATFKTMFCLLAMKAYLDKYEDAIGFAYDSEFSLSPDYIGSFGIDPARVLVTPVKNLDLLKNDIVPQLEQIKRGERVFVMIDSLGNLSSLKEFNDALEGKSTQDMTRAKMLKSLFRMITPQINMLDIPLFAILHTYQTQEMYSKTIISGGTGAQYSANVALIVSKRKNQQDKEEGGKEFVITVDKSRFVKEGQRFPIAIPEDGKLKKWTGLFDLALECGYIVKDGMKYSVPSIPDFEKAWKKDIQNSEQFWKMMFAKTDMMKVIEDSIKVSSDQSELFNAEEDEKELPSTEQMNSGENGDDEHFES